MRFLFLILISAMIFIVTPKQASAKLTVIEKTKYFTVTGKTGKQIYSQIRKRRPARMRKINAIAATQSYIRFNNVKFGIRKKKCVVVKTDIRLTLTYYYPKWKNRKGSSKNLQRKWAAFEKELRRHEKVHGKIYRDMGKTIEKEIRKATGRGVRGCRKLESTVKRKVRALRKKTRSKQAAFDRREQRSSSKIKRVENAFYKSK